MIRFPAHTLDTAPKEALPLLKSAQEKLGFVPNLYAQLAEAPAALEAYFSLSAAFDKTSLTPVERQVVLLAVSVENQCEFCVAAHSMIARRMFRVPDAVVDALRASTTIPDPHLEALAMFAKEVVRARGWVAGAAVERFIGAGYTQQQALEVVLGVTMKTLSNYSNHLTGTQPNEQFAGETWKRPG